MFVIAFELSYIVTKVTAVSGTTTTLLTKTCLLAGSWTRGGSYFHFFPHYFVSSPSRGTNMGKILRSMKDSGNFTKISSMLKVRSNSVVNYIKTRCRPTSDLSSGLTSISFLSSKNLTKLGALWSRVFWILPHTKFHDRPLSSFSK